MARVLIIGYGNPLRGDDGFGWRAAERLRVVIRDPEIEILTVHQLTPELMETLSHVATAIFLDAAASGEPGEIVRREVAGAGEGPLFTHQVSPEGLIGGARLLYGRAPAATLYSVAGADFSLSESLSPRVSSALTAAVEEILGILGTKAG